MALETVTIYILDDDVGNTPIQGFTVRIYDVTGTTFQTSAVTDANGMVEFTLDGDDPTPITYQVRGNKVGVSFPSPSSIDVYSPAANSPTGTNDFQIVSHVFVPPESSDPNLCRVSGTVRSGDGKPLKGVDVHFMPKFDPLIVEGDAVLGERVRVRSDDLGYVEFDLYRNGRYDCTLEGLEDLIRDVSVPDLPSANFANLVFPVVAYVQYSPAGPLNMLVGDTVDVTVTVTTSAGVVLEGAAFGDVTYSSDDTDVANATAAEGGTLLRVTAGAAGSTIIRAERIDDSIVHIPDNGITGSELNVVVT